MDIYYDFHIHTGLSPCGDRDMTPNNIVNMSLIKELDCIAVTDHNTCGNAEAVMQAAEGTPLVVVPGMEVETAEEVHVVCLFPTLEKVKEAGRAVEERLPKIPNNQEVYGEQLFFDAEDNIIGHYPHLLVTATTIDLYELVGMVKEMGGVAIPAHVDRQSYSVLSNLGFIPDDLDISLFEISRHAEPEAFVEEHRKWLGNGHGWIQNSDAHYLEDISERTRFITCECPSGQLPDPAEIVRLLRSRSDLCQ